MSYRVRLAKEHHVFSAAHFITFAGDVCERLHGHNYRVAVEVTGPLDKNQYVVDFIALRDELKVITDDLDHRVLLPASALAGATLLVLTDLLARTIVSPAELPIGVVTGPLSATLLRRIESSTSCGSGSP